MVTQETEKFIRRANALGKGITLTQKLIDQAEIPGGIESIQQDSRPTMNKYPISRISLIRESILDQARVLDEEVPPVLRKANAALTNKRSELAQINNPNTLTNVEAGILASAVQMRHNRKIQHKGEDVILKVDNNALEACVRLTRQTPGSSSTEPNKYIEQRPQVLSKVKKLLETIDSAYDSQENEDVKTLLLWLSIQDDETKGEIMELLSKDPKSPFDQTETKIVNRWERHFADAGITTSQIPEGPAPIVEELDELELPSDLDQGPTAGEAQALSDIEDKADILGTPKVGKVEKTKTLDIIKRDPEVENRITEILDQIDQSEVKKYGPVIKTGILNRLFPVIKQRVVEEMIDSKVVRDKSKDNFISFDLTDVAVILYAYHYGQDIGGVNKKLAKDLVLIITRQQEQREKSKKA